MDESICRINSRNWLFYELRAFVILIDGDTLLSLGRHQGGLLLAMHEPAYFPTAFPAQGVVKLRHFC